MRRSWLAVLIVGIALAIISLVNALVLTPTMTMPMSPNMMSNMMFWFTFWPALLVASLVIIALAVIMNHIYPQTARPPTSDTSSQLTAREADQPSGSIDVIMKILKPEELRIINLIKEAGGAIRQSDISRETNFSRLKVHRVIARLSERGIIRVEKAAQTNNVYLADWFQVRSDNT